jgi:hypothetical protein
MAGHVKRFVNSVKSYLDDGLLRYGNTIELRVSPKLASGPEGGCWNMWKCGMMGIKEFY